MNDKLHFFLEQQKKQTKQKTNYDKNKKQYKNNKIDNNI
jgi:hypothetical protein